jgi:hypothetical protein
VIGLDVALDRLIHLRAYRGAFLAGRFEALDVSAEDLETLATIDRQALAREADAVRDDLLHRAHRGSGGLLTLYPRVLAAWRAENPADTDLVELLSRFMESEAFAGYREIPFAGLGQSLEEAFYRFGEAEAIGDPEGREDEFLTAMTKALLVSPHPAFTLPSEIVPCPGGFFAVSRRGAPRLYAATGSRLVLGPLTPFLAELLLSPDAPAEIGARHGVALATLDAALVRLSDLGLRSPR